MAFEIEFTRLEAPGCQAEVRSDSAQAREASWVVDAGLERQCSNKAKTECRHQALADGIAVGEFASSVIQFTKGSVQHEPRIKHGQ